MYKIIDYIESNDFGELESYIKNHLIKIIEKITRKATEIKHKHKIGIRKNK